MPEIPDATESRRRSIQAQLEAASTEEFFVILANAAPALLGECHIVRDWEPLRPVMREDGLRWCCTHKPKQHCTEIVARIAKDQ